MKKWILGVLVLTGINFGLTAQQHKKFRQSNPTERAQKMSDRMTAELQLTEEQQKQINEVMLENVNRKEEFLQKRKAEFEAQRAFRKEQEQKIALILTEQQKQVWEQRKEALQHREEHQSRKGRARVGRTRFRRGN